MIFSPMHLLVIAIGLVSLLVDLHLKVSYDKVVHCYRYEFIYSNFRLINLYEFKTQENSIENLITFSSVRVVHILKNN